MNTKALHKLSYGLYLLSAREGERDNACIINTAIQTASDPKRISVAVIRENLTCEMIARTGRFGLSVLTQDAPLALFQRFGMQSGRDGDKFAGFHDTARTESGLLYLTKYANAMFSLRVTESHDLGSHVVFIGELEEAEVLSDGASCTYDYYQSIVKKQAEKTTVKKGWRCTVCGYIYEGETLPEDYLCPLCKHGPEVFEYFEEPVKTESKSEKWSCSVCGYEYDPAVGDPEHGIAPGTAWADLPADWVCPICGMGKDVFEKA